METHLCRRDRAKVCHAAYSITNQEGLQSLKSLTMFVFVPPYCCWSLPFHITAEWRSTQAGNFNEKKKKKKKARAGCTAVHFSPAYSFLYLRRRASRGRNNPTSVSFGNSAIIRERQFIIRLPLSRHQPSQLGPLRLPVSQPVSDSGTSLLSGLEGWRHRPNPDAIASTPTDCWGQGGDGNDAPQRKQAVSYISLLWWCCFHKIY